MFIPLIIAAAIAVSGSLGIYAANEALPGDVLYPVKIHLNENMKHMSAVGAEAEAKVSAELIARRAQEARLLQSEGKLDTDAKATLASQFKAEVEAWHENTDKLSAGGNAAIQAEVKAMIDSYSRTYGDVFQLLDVSLTSSSNTNVSGSSDNSVNGSGNSGMYVGSQSTSSTANGSTSTSLEINGAVDVNLGR